MILISVNSAVRILRMAFSAEDALSNIEKLTRALEEGRCDTELVCGVYADGFPSDFKLGVDQDDAGTYHISIKYYCLEERFRRWFLAYEIREIPYDKSWGELLERPIEKIWGGRW
jgi:hypothetical protein